MPGKEIRTCSKCGEAKPPSEYYPRYGYCKACTIKATNAYRAANRERANELAREAYGRMSEAQHERRRTRHREWRNGPGRETRKAIKQRYSASHKEKVAEYWAAYSKATWEARAEVRRANYDPDKKRASRNPAKMRENGRKRRALERDAFVEFVEESEIILRDEGRCGICGEIVGPSDRLEFDHIVPLAGGGWHAPDNLQMSHRSCNRRKGARLDRAA